MHIRWRIVGLLGLLAGPGCTFRTEVPATARVACHAESDTCPTGMRCRPAVGRCVSDVELAQPAVGVTGPQVAPSVGSLSTTFTLTFRVTEALARAPVAYASVFHLGGSADVQVFPFACGACAPDADCTCTWTPDPANPPPEEALQVQVEVVDVHGNAPTPVLAGSLQMDLSPPRVVGAVSVELTTPARVPVPVTALGPGVGAEVCFDVNEPLSGQPALRATPAAGPGQLDFAFDASRSSAARPCFATSLGEDAGVADGPLSLLATLTDAVGNAGERPVPLSPALELRTAPPAALDLGPDGGLRYHRAPWGEGGDETPHYRLESDGPAVPASGWLLVYADAQGQVELGRARVEPGALAALPFPGPDRAEVFVSLVGPGGTPAGAPELVRNVDWVATLGRKRAGDLTSNPHTCVARTVQWPALEAPGDFGAELSASAFADGGAALAAGGSTWARRTPPPVDGVDTAFAADVRRGLTVGYGTAFGPAPTLEYTAGRWTVMEDSRTSRLSQRESAAMAYDPAAGAVVLFGGFDVGQTQTMADTWAWSGAGWRRLDDGVPAALPDGGADPQSKPAPRRDAVAAYDADRQRLVVLGGQIFNGVDLTYTNDAWEWDGAAWHPLSATAGAALPPHHGGSLAYAAADDGGALVLVGGFVDADGGLDSTHMSTDSWVGRWGGEGYAWTKVGAGDAPASDSFVAYSPEEGLAAVSAPGGYTSYTGAVQLLRWQGPGAGWQTVLTQSGPDSLQGLVPAPGGGFLAMVVGPAGLFTYRCSVGASPGCREVSRPWDALSARYKARLAFDPTGRALRYGGETIDANDDTVSLAEGQLWGGDAWASVATTPGRRHNSAVAWSGVDQGFWLAGGDRWDGDFAPTALNDAWLLTDAGWTSLGSLPGLGGYSLGLAALPDGGMLASQSFGPTVVLGLDGTGQVTQLAQLSSDGQAGPLALDPVSGIFVGVDDGTTGACSVSTGVCNTLTGVPSTGATPVYDPASGSILFMGLIYGDRGDVWRLVGNSVETISAGDPEGDGSPPVVDQPGVAADPTNGTVLLVGGEISNTDFSSDTWVFSLANERPAGVCAFDFGSAQAPQGSEVRRLRLTTGAGSGRSAPGGAASAEGAVAQLWRAGRWADFASLAPAAQDLAHPAPVAFETTDARELRELLADRQTLGVALTPAAPNGTGLTSVSWTAPELEISYRLP